MYFRRLASVHRAAICKCLPYSLNTDVATLSALCDRQLQYKSRNIGGCLCVNLFITLLFRLHYFTSRTECIGTCKESVTACYIVPLLCTIFSQRYRVTALTAHNITLYFVFLFYCSKDLDLCILMVMAQHTKILHKVSFFSLILFYAK